MRLRRTLWKELSVRAVAGLAGVVRRAAPVWAAILGMAPLRRSKRWRAVRRLCRSSTASRAVRSSARRALRATTALSTFPLRHSAYVRLCRKRTACPTTTSRRRHQHSSSALEIIPSLLKRRGEGVNETKKNFEVNTLERNVEIGGKNGRKKGDIFFNRLLYRGCVTQPHSGGRETCISFFFFFFFSRFLGIN